MTGIHGKFAWYEYIASEWRPDIMPEDGVSLGLAVAIAIHIGTKWADASGRCYWRDRTGRWQTFCAQWVADYFGFTRKTASLYVRFLEREHILERRSDAKARSRQFYTLGYPDGRQWNTDVPPDEPAELDGWNTGVPHSQLVLNTSNVDVDVEHSCSTPTSLAKASVNDDTSLAKADVSSKLSVGNAREALERELELARDRLNAELRHGRDSTAHWAEVRRLKDALAVPPGG